MLLKGTNPDFDSYSLFFDNGDNGALGSTGLDLSLASKGVRTGKKICSCLAVPGCCLVIAILTNLLLSLVQWS